MILGYLQYTLGRRKVWQIRDNGEALSHRPDGSMSNRQGYCPRHDLIGSLDNFTSEGLDEQLQDPETQVIAPLCLARKIRNENDNQALA